jgi:preprotein translocase subunit SecA
VNRVLRRSGVEEPYEMSMEERLDAVHQLSDEDRGIYKSEIDYFIQSIDEMEKVKELGGLHVIGSERHDARRIDNQLRGRAARQGDPGSSRFYLSLQDDLMRLFGGQQVDGLMQRFQMDDALPLEHRMVSSVVEQSQTRVEGANFDARKHLLEYDDVLNSQRETIYAQRDRVFTKEDLSDDIHDFLEHEVGERIQAFANDDDAAWKLLAWLEQVQPTQIMGNVFVPSFMYKLLLDELTLKANDKASTSAALVEIAEGSIHAEEAHVRSATDEILASNEVWLDEQLEERLEALDTFTEALRYSDETDARSPKELFDEAQTVVRLPLSMSKNDQRLLRDDPDAAAESLTTQVEEQLTQQAAIRVIGAVERRLNASLELNARELGNAEWEALSQTVYDAVEAYFTGQRESLLGRDKLEAELDNALDRIEGEDYHVGHLLQLLLGMQQGTRIGFNPRTRRKEERRYMRFRYFFHAAKLLENYKQADLQAQVLKHLQHALGEMKRGWGAISQQQGGATPLAILPKPTRKKLEDALGAEAWAAKKGKSLSDLDFVEDAQALAIIGEYQLTEAHRQVLLRSISEMWIEYLTKMEALRVSIGLEAYGQRDPLVQYKAQASKMFAELIRDIRAQVVNRMFNIQPSAAQPTGAPQPGTPPQAQAAAQARSSNGDVEQAKPAKKTQEKKGKRSKKRRRHG